MFSKIRQLFQTWREKRLYKTLSEFAHSRPHLLIIVADPKTDTIFAAHKNSQTFNKIRNSMGGKSHVVRDSLSHSRFAATADNFIMSLAETLVLSIPKGNYFYKIVDGAVGAIAKALRVQRKEKAERTSIPVVNNNNPPAPVTIHQSGHFTA